MYCQNLSECFEQISAYAEGSYTSFPLIVDTENFTDFSTIEHRMHADDSKHCIYVSENTYINGIPNMMI